MILYKSTYPRSLKIATDAKGINVLKQIGYDEITEQEAIDLGMQEQLQTMLRKLSPKQVCDWLCRDINHIFVKHGFDDVRFEWLGQTQQARQAKIAMVAPHKHSLYLVIKEENSEYIDKWRACMSEVDNILETKFVIVHKNIGDAFRIVELKKL